MRDIEKVKRLLPDITFTALLAALSNGVALRTWIAFSNGLG